MVPVCTVLPAPERPRLDAAGDGCFTTLHTGSFRDALRAARRKRVDALVLSVHACRGDELPAVARFVREFPAIPAVALVSRHDRNASETLLRLGATGVRSAVDCTEPAGWRRLRDLVGHPASPVAARILARVVPALDEGTGDVRAFFEAVARLAPVLSTVRRLARHLRICSSTLMSRFYRADLPSPKTYLAGMRLVHAAYLFSNPGLSVSDVAYRLDYSSPQSFGRQLLGGGGEIAHRRELGLSRARGAVGPLRRGARDGRDLLQRPRQLGQPLRLAAGYFRRGVHQVAHQLDALMQLLQGRVGFRGHGADVAHLRLTRLHRPRRSVDA